MRKVGEASRFASSEEQKRDRLYVKTQNPKPKTQNYTRPVRRSFFFLSILSWAFAFQLQAQPHSPDLPVSSRPFDFYERGPYRPELPRPSDFFGYETGDFLTTFALYESLLREYQQHSDRLRVFTIGQTPEHRAALSACGQFPRQSGAS